MLPTKPRFVPRICPETDIALRHVRIAVDRSVTTSICYLNRKSTCTVRSVAMTGITTLRRDGAHCCNLDTVGAEFRTQRGVVPSLAPSVAAGLKRDLVDPMSRPRHSRSAAPAHLRAIDERREHFGCQRVEHEPLELTATGCGIPQRCARDEHSTPITRAPVRPASPTTLLEP